MFPTKGNSWLNHTEWLPEVQGTQPVQAHLRGIVSLRTGPGPGCWQGPGSGICIITVPWHQPGPGELRDEWPWQRRWRVFRVWVVWAAWWLPGQLSGIMIQERPRPVFIIHNHLHLHLRYAGSPSQPQRWNVSSICARCTECADSTNNSQQNSFPEF